MSDELICGFCSENLQPLTIPQREDHYEVHFIAPSPPVSTESSQTNKTDSKWQRTKKRFHPTTRGPWKTIKNKFESDIFWYPSLGVPPPRNFTPGLISILTRSLTALCAKGKVSRAVLCNEKVVHISKELWDAGWGCGYRNFLMLCTGLFEQQIQPLYFALLDASPPPSVRNLQSWVKSAWDNGYDQIGRNELRNKITGTNKWIGTAEIYVALSYRGIPAELIDFNGFKDKESCAATVIQWIVNYFDSDTSGIHRIPSTSINDVLGKATPVVASQLMPVILQHRGHSRLIVGYQRDAEGITSLLTFDTGRLLPLGLRNIARSSYGPLDDISPEHSEPGPSSPEQLTEEGTGNERPITLMDLLTPSERELERGHMLNAEPSRQDNIKTKIMSRLKVDNRQKTGRAALGSKFTASGIKAEPDPRQMQRLFRLSPQQLALNMEYQVLYVPLRPPLTEEEKLSRKVVKCRQISYAPMVGS